MFQNFQIKSDPSSAAPRVAALREVMVAKGVDVAVVPHADEFQNEYLPARAERLAWLTGFTGSAGLAIIMQEKAVVLTDGRYTLQVAEQTDPDTFDTGDLTAMGLHGWLRENARDKKIGIDPWLHTVVETRKLQELCKELGATLVELDENPVDVVWDDQPSAPTAPVIIHPIDFAGVTAKQKIKDLTTHLRNDKLQAHIVTDTASIAWLFNIRGNDVGHTPLTLARAIVPARGSAQLFIDPEKLDMETTAYLTQICDIRPEQDFVQSLAATSAFEGKVSLDGNQAAHAIANHLEAAGAEVIEAEDPTRLPRAMKNRAEIAGARAAHLRDGAAMVHFLAWLDANRQTPGLDEITIAKELEEARRATAERLGMPLKDISFDTISGTGPNGAIVHYRVDEKSNRTVAKDDLILIDSGGQYQDGTTDITRVIAAGEPTAEQRHRFTLVLKGMIAVSQAHFPPGTRGMDLDVLARNALWQAGLDYAHGTGHGVGSYLGVHEGPQNISKRGTAPLRAGMIISNEPGYYKTGEYGIRIENLVLVKPKKVPENGDIAMHRFETLTYCPIDRRLIDQEVVTAAERQWVDGYHRRVQRKLSPLIEDQAVLDWLRQATASL